MPHEQGDHVHLDAARHPDEDVLLVELVVDYTLNHHDLYLDVGVLT